MLKKIFIGITLFFVVLLIVAAFKPSHMVISRELLINAFPDVIFPHINNSKKANDWMPWTEVDKAVVLNYSGPIEGVGSASSWDSNGQMGTGNAVVVESKANQSVKTQLTYSKPMSMSQLAEITLTPAGNGTLVRWSVTGENSFICRFMTIFMSMDKVVGEQFEKGLLKLKTTVEVK